MRYLPDGIQMKGADAYTIGHQGIPSLVLMERAALETVKVMRSSGMDLTKALVVCGSGNNGGDGFAVARLLTEEGLCAEVLFAGKETSLSEECALQKKITERMGIPVFTDIPDEEYTVIIDAVFGVGLSREITGRYCGIIRWMNEQKCAKAAVDIPSGVCAQTGNVLGIAFRADLTVAMACVKVGCELFPGKSFSGKTIPVPIGINPDYFANDPDVCVTFDRDCLGDLLPRRKADSHKGTYGKVLMITGSAGMAGASYLSARAAYAVGAGLVQIYTAEENRTILQQLLPEAIISCYKEYDREHLESLLKWADVVCIGCGLGKSDTAGRLLADTIQMAGEGKIPCIIDADGLNLLSGHMELLGEIHSPVILTPHMKEMSRLTGKRVEEIAENRRDLLREFVREYPVTCVLKDSRTLVAEQGRHTFVNLAGNSAMAKAGSGDVLSGVITGLAAQGMSGWECASLGVFLHACGGDEARTEKGSYSVLAGDLIRGIEKAMKEAEENIRK